MTFQDFWYVVAQSEQLKSSTVLSRLVLNEWLVIFRGENGQAVALRDRCIHRNSRLSCGKVNQGRIQCPYHGWVYDQSGKVVEVPSEGESFQPLTTRCSPCYAAREQDGYIYVRLASDPSFDSEPYRMPHYRQSGWETVRVIHRFHNSVTNCAENFIDIPHTAFVHPGLFRTSQHQGLEMTVKRIQGSVWVEYRQEKSNLGWFGRFLNFNGSAIEHTDQFQMPNITHVRYRFGSEWRLLITSQSIPESDRSTLVYTDVTYRYGFWNWLARPWVEWTAKKIIRQDVEILGIQQDVIDRYGQKFANTPADMIHQYVESIRTAIAAGKDPRELPDQSVDIQFWV